MSEEEDDDVGIKPGTVIDSHKANYVVISLLGEGGFGAVYKVHDQKDHRKEYAMKIEKKIEQRRHSKLKMEIAILKLVAAERRQSHFTSIIDRGKKDTYFFLVMELVGKSLADLKAHRPNKVFTVPTSMGAGIQCLEACEDLHKHGFIHRDLKPANYACGLGSKKRVGTIRFASIACHKNMEMGPKDDCESWFYLLLDITIVGGLLWKSKSDKNDVLKVKEQMRTEKRDVAFGLISCREQLYKMLDYIDSLKYHDHVDYEFIYKLAQQAAKCAGGDVNDPYDWERTTEATATTTIKTA
ncbi:hypothetical protein DICVIV_09656 [Dictyocaulus viviparus]|uniref:Protein kinase domain-containing protein n=1 Tax=Dictyocaulus viviparus TaxID=29172 RepID=A0A0D8XKH3_DICVI|nr:hypothetical protein DICVIV_09656 [Dictyocaulus viviparus]